MDLQMKLVAWISRQILINTRPRLKAVTYLSRTDISNALEGSSQVVAVAVAQKRAVQPAISFEY